MSQESPPNDGSHGPTPIGVERDPFPKMIIACMITSAVLFVVIASVIMYDFIERQQRMKLQREQQPAATAPAPAPAAVPAPASPAVK